MSFRIDRRYIKFGSSHPVKLFNLAIDRETCQVKTFSLLPSYFAAYVKVPNSCSKSDIVRNLDNYASFVFLDGSGSEDDYKLLPNGLIKPVFVLAANDMAFAAAVNRRLAYDEDDLESMNMKHMNIQISIENVQIDSYS